MSGADAGIVKMGGGGGGSSNLGKFVAERSEAEYFRIMGAIL